MENKYRDLNSLKKVESFSKHSALRDFLNRVESPEVVIAV